MRGVPVFRVACILVALLLPASSSPVSAKDVLVQSENFEHSLNIAFLNFVTVNGWLQGLDYPGEWLTYSFETDEYGSVAAELHCMGEENVDYHLRLTLTPVDFVGQQTIDFVFTGHGCSG
ncbi:MAG: hypothetical protein JW876_04815 [Candidatus Krumholzibacteriota bacterium]|nr:hypothetical protein [Candidatus Krumholzibacteriota bacterium]